MFLDLPQRNHARPAWREVYDQWHGMIATTKVQLSRPTFLVLDDYDLAAEYNLRRARTNALGKLKGVLPSTTPHLHIVMGLTILI